MSGWIKRAFAENSFGPGHKAPVKVDTGEVVQPNRVLAITENVGAHHDGGDLEIKEVLGVSVNSSSATAGEVIYAALAGEADVTLAYAVSAYAPVKVYTDGKVGPALDESDANVSFVSELGTGFTNQPANDGIEVVSSSASDVQYLDLYGTTNGGVVVVKERVLLTGTTAVATTKTDWGVLLGAIIPNGLGAAAVGTITIREASGNATITTITAGNRSSGVITVASADQVMHCLAPSAVCDGASTKVLGLVGTDTDCSTTVMAGVTLAGITPVSFAQKFSSVQYALVGDVGSSTTVDVKTSAFYDVEGIVGVATEAGAAGDVVEISITFVSPSVDERKTGVQRFVDGSIAAADVLALATAPYAILPPPPAGYGFTVDKVLTAWDYGSAAVVAGSMTTIDLKMGSTTIWNEILPVATLAGTADSTAVLLPYHNNISNGALLFEADADATSGGTGSVFGFKILYRIVPLIF